MLKKMGMAALAALTIAGSSAAMTSAADAQGRHGGWRGGHHGYHGGHHGYRGHRGGGFGFVAPAIIGGLALGAAASHYGYGYGRECWVQRRVFVDDWGRRFVRPVRVCG